MLALTLVNAGGAEHAALFGTGNTGGIGGTVLWEFDLHGTPLLVMSRLVPIGLALVITWWVVRRIGPASLEPVALIALVALSLSLRLVFEQQLFGYYFMALSVALVLLDVASGHIRSSLVAWLATVSMVYVLGSTSLDVIHGPWHAIVQDLVPLSVLLLAAILIVRHLRRGGRTWMLALYVGMIVSALLSWDDTDFLGQPPTWFWQLVLVPVGIALAAGPLLSTLHQHREVQALDEVAPSSSMPALE